MKKIQSSLEPHVLKHLRKGNNEQLTRQWLKRFKTSPDGKTDLGKASISFYEEAALLASIACRPQLLIPPFEFIEAAGKFLRADAVETALRLLLQIPLRRGAPPA